MKQQQLRPVLLVPLHHSYFMTLFPPPSLTMIPPPPWTHESSNTIFFQQHPQEMTILEEPQQKQQLQDLNLFEEPDQLEQSSLQFQVQLSQEQPYNTYLEEPEEQPRMFCFLEETQQQLPEQDLIVFDDPQSLALLEDHRQQELDHVEEPQRSIKPLQQRHLQPQPPVAIVYPHQQQQRRHTLQSIIDEPTVIDLRVLPQISNEELLRRHGIMDCSVNIGILPVITTTHQGRRKRKSERDPTYNPSRRIRRQSIEWAETRVLRQIPMREIRNLRKDIEILNEGEV